jgi:hypothetical protein
MRRYAFNVLMGLDIFANTLLGGKVRTISARIGEKKAAGEMDVLTSCIDWVLEKIDPGHSLDAYENWRRMTDRTGQKWKLEKVD